MPNCGEPAAAPDPVAVHGIDDHGDKQAVDAEGRELPALGQGAGGDGGRGVHEDHLEEEEGHHRDVIGTPGQEKAFVAEEAEVLAEEMEGHFVAQIGAHAQGRSLARRRPT